MTKKPSFNREQELNAKFDIIFGIDEVGRGSFAGPLVACAVAFNKEHVWFDEINDSKLLNHKERKKLSKLILNNSICFIENIDINFINEFGVGEANRIIFVNLISKILKEFRAEDIYFLIDGKRKRINYKNIEFSVKGDQKHISIAAASIVAKEYRDDLMVNFSKIYKGYNFSKNKGYGTKFHRQAIKKLGLCEIHRKSFDLSRFL